MRYHQSLRLFGTGFVAAALTLAASVRGGFRVPPYLQDVGTDAISVVWWSPDPVPGVIEWGATRQYGDQATSSPRLSAAISTVANGAEQRMRHPYRHEVRLTGLGPNTRYFYRVTQDDASWAAEFTTAPDAEADFTFVVAADPESKATEPRRSEIHRAVLDQIQARDPRFLVYAGDLVDQGNAQDDWDSFWSDLLRSSPMQSIASTVPIYAALGNHDYDGLSTTLGGNKLPYAQPFAEAGVAKYRSYFSFPSNDHAASDPQCERYYSFRYGPVTIVVLDTNNDSISTDDPKSNWDTGRWEEHPLVGENEPSEPGGRSFAPDIHGGISGRDDSRQYRWLIRTLRQAADESSLVFVVMHQPPYSSFPHGDPGERQSGHPLRKLDALFHRYGVAAVFSGHDEAYERSVTAGGLAGAHQVHYYVIPTIGDPTGLRKPVSNPAWQTGFGRFVYPVDNRHHGYLSVRVEPLRSGRYQATVTPHYYDEGDPQGVNHSYDDVVRIEGRAAK